MPNSFSMPCSRARFIPTSISGVRVWYQSNAEIVADRLNPGASVKPQNANRKEQKDYSHTEHRLFNG